MSALHPDLAIIAPLLGSWTGAGHGEYPTIESFDYVETVTFGHVGKPFLAYGQRTRNRVTDLPMHAETGYWRCPSPGRLEVVLTHPTGITEIEEGTVDANPDRSIEIELATVNVSISSTAKHVSEIRRSILLDGDQLSYRVSMAAVGLPLQHHLAATLTRTE